MEIAKYSFYPQNNIEENDWEHILYSFFAALYKNGQILNKYLDVGCSEGAYTLYCRIAEPESLDGAFYKDACWEAYNALLEKSRAKPQFEIVASIFDASTCNCGTPEFYVLHHPILYESAPVFCGKCEAMVPLYRLPLLKNAENYEPLLDWAREYLSYYAIYLNSYSMGKKAGRMLYSVSSSLTKMGLRLCHEMALNTGKEFLYYLGDSESAIGIHKHKKVGLKEAGVFRYKYLQEMVLS